MGFEDLGVVVVPLLALLLYHLVPASDDEEGASESTAPLGVLADEALESGLARSEAARPPAPSPALVQVAPLLLLGLVGYVVLMVIRATGVPHRS